MAFVATYPQRRCCSLLFFSTTTSSKVINFEDGQVGSGPNWIERSFPVTDGTELDADKVDDWNVGIDGERYVRELVEQTTEGRMNE